MSKLTKKLANAERVADEAIDLAKCAIELFENFINTLEILEDRAGQFPATHESIAHGKSECERLRNELEVP